MVKPIYERRMRDRDHLGLSIHILQPIEDLVTETDNQMWLRRFAKPFEFSYAFTDQVFTEVLRIRRPVGQIREPGPVARVYGIMDDPA